MGEKTQNGWAYPEKKLTDDEPRELKGGGGNAGLNALGQPYATAAIGSGPVVEAIGSEFKNKRAGMSTERNFERSREMTDRKYDNERDYQFKRR